MILVGLTGGIGSGKSTVSALLARKGAVIVDADAITRQLQAPGHAVFARIVERFGTAIVAPDGSLDRSALAAVAFADPDALADLNAIVHPAVAAEISRRIDEQRGGDAVVVLDIPLLAENPRDGLAATLVVDCPVEVAVARLVAHRGFREDDARARVARQASREARLAIATKVLDNGGSAGALATQIDELWPWLTSLPATSDDDLARYRARSPR